MRVVRGSKNRLRREGEWQSDIELVEIVKTDEEGAPDDGDGILPQCAENDDGEPPKALSCPKSGDMDVSRRNPCVASRPRVPQAAVESLGLITASLPRRRSSPSSAVKRHANQDLLMTDSFSSLEGDRKEKTPDTRPTQ